MQPRLLVFTQLFPSDAQPAAGLFIRERVFRVGRRVPLAIIVAPQPWFPFQSVLRWFRPHFRPMTPRCEVQRGFAIHRPRFLCVPGILKRTDGLLLALCTFFAVRRLVREHRINLIDAHFGYPDGYAATLLGRWLKLPVVVTFRGKEERQTRMDVARPLRRAALHADRIVCVSEALRDVAIGLGADPARTAVVGNGVDLDKFHPVPRSDARSRARPAGTATILVSVGGLVERKGFHRVIGILPRLLARFPDLHYLVVGGSSPEGDISARLKAQAAAAGLASRVHFLGQYAPEDLKIPYSAADLFVLATSYEGWANVFLEAMACGLPVVTTRVGGNAQVVCSGELGLLVEFGDPDALARAITEALAKRWNREQIIAYARHNDWDQRVAALLAEFDRCLRQTGDLPRWSTPGT